MVVYRKSEILEDWNKKYNIKRGKRIDLNVIKEIERGEKVYIKDILCLLQINSLKWWKLKNGKQTYVRLKFNQFSDIEYKKVINIEKINYLDFINLQKSLKMSANKLCQLLGITNYMKNKMIKDEQYKVLVKNMKVQHIVNLIEIDIKYLEKYGDRYYERKELEKICCGRKITVDSFLKYHGNYRRYKCNQIALDKCAKGLWIGQECRMDKGFINTNHKLLTKRIKIAANRISLFEKLFHEKEDLIDIAVIELYEKCGGIVKKFFFSEKLMYNILIYKAKNYMLRAYDKYYKEDTYIHYDGYDNKDAIKILGSEAGNPYRMI